MNFVSSGSVLGNVTGIVSVELIIALRYRFRNILNCQVFHLFFVHFSQYQEYLFEN